MSATGEEYTHWYLTSDKGWVRGLRQRDGHLPEGSLDEPPANAVAVWRYQRWGYQRLRNELRPLGILTKENGLVDALLRQYGPCPRRL